MLSMRSDITCARHLPMSGPKCPVSQSAYSCDGSRGSSRKQGCPCSCAVCQCCCHVVLSLSDCSGCVVVGGPQCVWLCLNQVAALSSAVGPSGSGCSTGPGYILSTCSLWPEVRVVRIINVATPRCHPFPTARHRVVLDQAVAAVYPTGSMCRASLVSAGIIMKESLAPCSRLLGSKAHGG